MVTFVSVGQKGKDGFVDEDVFLKQWVQYVARFIFIIISTIMARFACSLELFSFFP